MTRIAYLFVPVFAVGLSVAGPAVGPVMAQDHQAETGDGPTMMERGARLFLKGLMEEMEPALRDLETLTDQAAPAMQSFLREMGPALAELFADVKDFSAYHPPEILPNGDINLRKKAPQDPAPDGDLGVDEDAPKGEVEL